MIIHLPLPYSHLQHNTFLFCCCILVPLLYYSVVTHVYILPCALLVIIAIPVQSYNAYCYIGDPDIPQSLVRSAPATVQPVIADG